MSTKKIALLIFLLFLNGFTYALARNKDDYIFGFISISITWLITANLT